MPCVPALPLLARRGRRLVALIGAAALALAFVPGAGNSVPAALASTCATFPCTYTTGTYT